MIDRREAEEHLRVIRSLMEKATIYRAISAPSALVGGLLTIGAGAGTIVLGSEGQLGFLGFMIVWGGVLAVTAAANVYFIWREARARGDLFFSPGMRLALRAMIPSLVAGGVLALCFPESHHEVRAVVLWVIFYGLSLLSTAHFAPRSIVFLGVAFVIAGLGFALEPLVLERLPIAGLEDGNGVSLASGMMVLTFGLFHVAYAVGIWLRPEPRTGQPRRE